MRLVPPFRADGDHITVDLPGAQALFTTRRGGVSEGAFATLNLGLWTDDDAACVLANRDRVAALAGVPRSRFAQGLQVHGATVRRVTEPPPPALRPAPADGQATALRGVAPVVLTADCVPVALAAGSAVAMVHAGWRGLAGGVVAEGIRALRELDGDGPIVAALGPAAGGCCYEVGDQVRTALAAHPGAISGGRADLKLAAREQLDAAGVDECHDVGICTICSDPALFFSHRRDGELTGRQAGVVWRT